MRKKLLTYSNLCEVIPNGTQTLSKMPCRYPKIYPKILCHGKAGHVWGTDGREFIDLISGLGSISVGYCNDAINSAIKRQLDIGISFSLSTELEYDVAKELIRLIPFTEMWKFGKNGTDANVYAVRAARAYSGRTRIMTVGYNGCADVFECKGVRNAGIPKDLSLYNTRAIYNDIGSFSNLITEEYACVLIEPMVNMFPKTEFLEELRDLCTRTGTVLIFDEIVTGGRFEGFVASNYFKIEPDIITIGKGIANGLPLSAVGGKRHIMQTFERDDFFASGTFGGECLSLAACLETLKQLESKITQMLSDGYAIQNWFNDILREQGKCVGYPTRLDFVFNDIKHKWVFWQEMCKEGILLGYNNFVMADHTNQDITKVIKKFAYIDFNTPLEGPIPQGVVRNNG